MFARTDDGIVQLDISHAAASQVIVSGILPSLARKLRGLIGGRLDFRHLFWISTFVQLVFAKRETEVTK